MDNPLLQPAPEDRFDRIRTLARDLAYGAVNGLWSSRITVSFVSRQDPLWWINPDGDPNSISDYLEKKWENKHCSAEVLMSFGFMALMEKRDTSATVYLLTEKAFALLEKPTAPPSVFISYRRNQSSALGLLVVARLKAVGVPNPFIDMVIDPGAQWHALLEKTVRQSTYCIALIAPGTLDSTYVQQEIKWALDTPGMTVIPLWHGGFQAGNDYPAELSVRNAIRIKEESAEEYEMAMIKLLNRLGYGP
ncbi:MAG: toll/interleukin-1 receptor domain-containing protein [Anaerolineae bacterium]|nr:toll/interleukin-1 receptor domain-containing protein [Anaerolineae bacterium]